MFLSYPAPCFLSNNLSALRHPDFVHAISEHFDSGCIMKHSEPPFCVNPLTVPEGKTLCLLIDLRHVLNCHLVRGPSLAVTGSSRGALDTTMLICGTVTDSVLSLNWHTLTCFESMWSRRVCFVSTSVFVADIGL